MTNLRDRPRQFPPRPTEDCWRTTDIAHVGVVAAAAAFWCWWAGWRGSRPAEDAAILFRYVDNVAAGHGIVWNVGEPPVDGATDLGFMLILAAVRSSGVQAETAALMVNTLAFVCTAVVLFVFARRRIGRLTATLVAAVFIFSPAVALMHVGFGAVFFGAATAFAALAMFRLTDEPTLRSSLLLACVGTTAGLIRPEGFLIVGVLVMTAAVIGGRGVVRAAVLAAVVLLVAGMVFVAVRWAYFGFPLPNPYYKKGGGTLHLDGLFQSLKFAVTVGAVPLVLLVSVGVFGRVTRRWIAYVGCIGVLLGMWALLSSEMNYSFRFQFPILNLALLMAVDVASRTQPEMSLRAAALPRTLRRLTPVAIVAAVAFQFAVGQLVLSKQSTDVAHETVATVLAQSGDDQLVVATTEAGYICWKSGWTCIDTWGLNDKRIAHGGPLGEVELAELNPDVIVVHAPTAPTATSIHAADFSYLPGWEAMTDPMIRFAEAGEYTLAAILRPQPDSGIAVYVRSGRALSDHLIAEFGEVEPTIEQFYGRSTGSHPSLPTTE